MMIERELKRDLNSRNQEAFVNSIQYDDNQDVDIAESDADYVQAK